MKFPFSNYMNIRQDELEKVLLMMQNNEFENNYRSEIDWLMENLVSINGGIAIVSITGALASGESLWYSTYSEISNILIELETKPEIKGVILNIDSPGGDALGMAELQNVLNEYQKPIVAYTETMMASAAYYIGSYADYIVVSPSALVGSIGTYSILMSYKKMFESVGIDIEIIRENTNKALGNPYEKITDEARKDERAIVKGLYDIFVKDVSKNRGIDEETIYNTKSRIYLASEALENNLIDKVGTLKDAINFITQNNNERFGIMSKEVENKAPEIDYKALFEQEKLAKETAQAEILQEKIKNNTLIFSTKLSQLVSDGKVTPAAKLELEKAVKSNSEGALYFEQKDVLEILGDLPKNEIFENEDTPKQGPKKNLTDHEKVLAYAKANGVDYVQAAMALGEKGEIE